MTCSFFPLPGTSPRMPLPDLFARVFAERPGPASGDRIKGERVFTERGACSRRRLAHAWLLNLTHRHLNTGGAFQNQRGRPKGPGRALPACLCRCVGRQARLQLRDGHQPPESGTESRDFSSIENVSAVLWVTCHFRAHSSKAKTSHIVCPHTSTTVLRGEPKGVGAGRGDEDSGAARAPANGAGECAADPAQRSAVPVPP